MQKLDPNLKIIDEIFNENKNINTMSIKELESLRLIIKENHINKDKLIEKALTPITNICSIHIKEPYWFSNNTKYEDNVWYIKLSKTIKKIDFSLIKLSDNRYLTEEPELINTFKMWILIQGHPKYNNSQILNDITILRSINKVILLIDNIINNANVIGLLERKAFAINGEFFKDIIIKICNEGAINATYNYPKKVEKFLINKIKAITKYDLDCFESLFPLIRENYNITNLNLTLEQIQKSKCWLYKNGAYRTKKPHSNLPDINLNKIDCIRYINSDKVKQNKLNELSLFSNLNETEYPFAPCRNSSENSTTYRTICDYIEVVQKINYVNSYDFCSPVNSRSLSQLSGKYISNQVEILQIGRYKSVPSKVILDSIKNGFEFIFQYMDSILDSIFTISCIATEQYNRPSKYNNWRNLKKHTWKTYVSPKLIKLGVTHWNVKHTEVNCFESRRKNKGLCDLYDVLMGSILVVIGAITARRQSELIYLHPTDCLFPKNIDPTKNKLIDFEIIFDNRKSGIGGINNVRESLSRPIPHSLAEIIYKLQLLNKNILNSNKSNISNLSLINNYNHHQNKFIKITASTHNILLNAFCDYFETPIIPDELGSYKRFYLRQHQFRRFFALLFFWSKSYDGLDTLTHFMGHTNPEHLYNYITESITGEVLAGAKAQVITEQICMEDQIKQHIQNIELLSPILEKFFGIREFEILSESELLSLFGSDKVVQHMKNYSLVEQQITFLINNNIIDLEPEFFTVRTSEGKIIRDFNLVLRIRDQII